MLYNNKSKITNGNNKEQQISCETFLMKSKIRELLLVHFIVYGFFFYYNYFMIIYSIFRLHFFCIC